MPVETSVPVQAFGYSEKLDPQKLLLEFDYDRTYITNKPYGGLWTSSYIPKEQREEPDEYSLWAQWCKWNEFCLDKYMKVVSILYPKKDLKVFVINTPKDLMEVSKAIAVAYPEQISQFLPSRVHYFERLRVIDYPTLFQKYDGVRVTDQAACAMHRFPDPDDLPEEFEYLRDLNCWDCESTVWKNTDWVDHVKYEVIRH